MTIKNIPKTTANIAKRPEEIVAGNLKKFITKNRLTQRELAEKLGITASSMTDYVKGRRMPGTDFFIALKKLYNIDIDAFLTKDVSPTVTASISQNTGDSSKSEMMDKFCGLYYIYYIDPSPTAGRDVKPPTESLLYGILYVYKESSSHIDNPVYSCAAILGIKDRGQVTGIKEELEKLEESYMVIERISLDYKEMAYYGDFELSGNNVFISLRHETTDRALVILNKVTSNKECYIGGLGTINSVSKGRHHVPVIQYIGLSRYTLTMSAEEIHHSLLLGEPDIKASAETDELIKLFKALYMDPNRSSELTEYQKSIMIRSTLERFIKQSLERNVFRYGKVDDDEDDDFYHLVKHMSVRKDV